MLPNHQSSQTFVHSCSTTTCLPFVKEHCDISALLNSFFCVPLSHAPSILLRALSFFKLKSKGNRMECESWIPPPHTPKTTYRMTWREGIVSIKWCFLFAVFMRGIHNRYYIWIIGDLSALTAFSGCPSVLNKTISIGEKELLCCSPRGRKERGWGSVLWLEQLLHDEWMNL